MSQARQRHVFDARGVSGIFVSYGYVQLLIRVQKNNEADLPLEEQHEVLMNRKKYANRHIQAIEARKLDSLLKDPISTLR